MVPLRGSGCPSGGYSKSVGLGFACPREGPLSLDRRGYPLMVGDLDAVQVGASDNNLDGRGADSHASEVIVS